MECECQICKEGMKSCPRCESDELIKGTFRDKGKKFPKYRCKSCKHVFIDIKIPLNEKFAG